MKSTAEGLGTRLLSSLPPLLLPSFPPSSLNKAIIFGQVKNCLKEVKRLKQLLKNGHKNKSPVTAINWATKSAKVWRMIFQSSSVKSKGWKRVLMLCVATVSSSFVEEQFFQSTLSAMFRISGEARTSLYVCVCVCSMCVCMRCVCVCVCVCACALGVSRESWDSRDISIRNGYCSYGREILHIL